MSLFETIDYQRWSILDALADDWESPEQIAKYFAALPDLPQSSIELTDLLTDLFERNFLFLTLNQRFDREAILAELNGLTENRPFWFGRTEIGYQAWCRHSEQFSALK